MSLRAVFGGTFDPIHFGHLRCAWEVGEALAAPVHMIPACRPVHRDVPGATARQRMEMLQLALGGQTRLLADDREIQRGGPSYMIDTLDSLSADFPQDTSCLVVGQDAFAGFHRWHRWQEIFGRAHIVVMARPGSDPELPLALSDFIAERRVSDPERLASSRPGHVLEIQVTALDISATTIRQAMSEGRSARFLVPKAVLDYIDEFRLYEAPSGSGGL